jgi:hypothetical protein
MRGGEEMAVKVEIIRLLERHRIESKGKPIWLVHALVKVRSEGEDYVRLFVPMSVVLEEGKEYPVLFNGIALRVKEEEYQSFGYPFDAKIPKSSGLP